LFKTVSAGIAVGLAMLTVVRIGGQVAAPALTLLSADARRALPIAMLNDREFVALDDLATAFQLTVRQEAGAITVTYKSGTVVLTPDQTLASVAGRLISLPAAPTRSNGRLMVPIEFITRALAPIYDARLDLRRPSRLLVVGDLRVPRVTIQVEPMANASRLTIETTPRTSSSVTQDGSRLTIAFEADALDVAMPAVQAPGFVQAIRLLDPVTLGVDLGPRFAAYRTSSQTSDSAARLLVDLLSLTAEAGPLAPVPAPAATAAPPPDPRLLGAAAPAFRTLVIDPGHGGQDPGVRGAGGAVEKDLTLSVARRLKSLVEGRLGVRVLLTREDDRDVPLDRRTAVANNNKADVFISLHANASPLESARGASIRVAAFDADERARARIALERLPVFGGGSRPIDLVFWDLAQVRHVDRSNELAGILQQQLRGRVPLDPRPIGREPFRVLESANMPAVLVEMGYLSNAEQEQLIGGGEFQDTFAQAVLDSLLRFRDLMAGGGGDR
jgi:N-acetylmuramoyl-L-alanine amidase